MHYIRSTKFDTIGGGSIYVTVVVGGFFGDEGKGKIVSYLALKDDVDIGIRAGVGPNAGHTVYHQGKEFKLRQIPSSFVNERTRLLIPAGVLINPKLLLEEIEATRCHRRLGIDAQVGIIEGRHIEYEKRSNHLVKKIGSTKSGCGMANAERALRKLKLAYEVPELKPYIANVSAEVNDAIDTGKRVLIEGTQGTFLSLYHGTYPFVTSKDTTASACCADVGIGPTRVTDVMVVFKSYITRVGEGPLPGELSRDEIEKRGWVEVATVTGRIRRAAPFNFELAKIAVRLNGATQIALTKLDILFPKAYNVRDFESLPKEAKTFIEDIESELKVPVTLVSTGPYTEQVIDLRGEKL